MACDYLFTVDMEMEPVPGYEFSNWDLGYGDVHLAPDLGTLRKLSWLDRTALVICDAELEPSHEPVTVAPRSILRRQIERLRAKGFEAMAGSELEYYLYRTSYLGCGAERVSGPEQCWLVHRGLRPAARYADRGPQRSVSPTSRSVRGACRVNQRRVRTRTARAEHSLRADSGDGGPSHCAEAGGQRDFGAAWRECHVHGKTGCDAGRVELASPREPLGGDERRVGQRVPRRR